MDNTGTQGYLNILDSREYQATQFLVKLIKFYNLVEWSANSILVGSRIHLKGLQIAGKAEIVDTTKIV